MIYDVVIAGAGVTGAFIARELSRYDLSVCVLEKENDVAMGASKANSGIIHGGFDPEPNTLKAKLNVKGVPLLYAAAQMLSVPFINNGSMVCAFDDEQAKTLDELYNRGLINGINDMQLISGDEAREIEPELSSEIVKVLLVNNAGIICPYELTVAAIGNAMDNGVSFEREFEVCGISKSDDIFTVTAANAKTVKAKYFINCAGCYADKIAEMIDDKFYEIIARPGEYLLLDKAEGKRVSHTIFQVPSKEGKGILVSPTVDGNLLTGPTARVADSPESKEITADGISTVIKLASKSVPSVQFRQVITSFTGVRSSEKNGDFIIEESKKVKGFVHVSAIDSPGLSSCAAIAKYVVDILKDMGVPLTERLDWNGKRQDPHFFKKMNDEQKDAFIKNNADYGKVVCRCETVSEGEIRDAIRRNPGARDVDGVKRRTRSGMGRCQGGFCMPYVIKLISEETGVPVEQITKKGKNSKILVGRI